MLSLKCDHPFYMNYSSYFQQWSLNYDITVPSSSIGSKFGFWNVSRGLCIFPNFSQFIKRVKIEIFEKAWLHFQIFSNSLKSLKIEILSNGEDRLSVRHVASERRSQFMIKLSVFKKKYWYYNVGNNFVSISELETLFPNINVGINCNMFLWLCP